MNSVPPALTPSQVNYADTSMWEEILKQVINDLRVSIPAIVQAVDYTKNPPVVAVQIAIQEIVRTAAGPVDTSIWPIFNVPIILPSAGGFSLTLPVAVGDEGLLTFCDMCIDLWWTRGCSQNSDGTFQAQPQFERRRHDIADCGWSPGMRSQARPLTNWSQNSAQLRTDDGTTYVEIAGSQIVNIVAPGGLNITAPTVITGTLEVTEAVTLDEGLTVTDDATIDGIDYSTHVHSGVSTGGGDTGPPVP